MMIHVLKFPVVLIETLLREVDLHLLTFPFHLKSVPMSMPVTLYCSIIVCPGVPKDQPL